MLTKRAAQVLSVLAIAGAVAGCGGGSASQQPTSPSHTAGADTAGSAQPGAAHVVERMRAGGVIELTGERGDSMDRARAVMEAHCGAESFRITREGEEVVDGDTPPDGGASVPTTAWRVHYQCAAAAPAP